MWLLAENVARELRSAMANTAVTAEQRAKFAASVAEARDGNAPRSLRIAGDVGEIRVEGLLTQRPDFWAWLLGHANTTYSDLRAALSVAENDPVVKRISFFVDSPGGQVNGLFDAIGAIEAAKKPRSVTAAYACSAAYAIAAVAGKIEATNAAVTVGSVGVVASYLVDDELIEITSTEAPDKRPDPKTTEGQAVIRRYLDAVHQLFAETIARGRGVDVHTVNTKFGRGAVLLAGDAKRLGMIDSIAGATRTHKTRSSSAEDGADRVTAMDAKSLKREFPEGAEALVAEGRAEERDRVTAHLTMGQQSGCMDTAHKAIRDGSAMTASLQAEYMSAALNRRDRQLRQEESDATGRVLEGIVGAGSDEGPGDVGMQTVAIMMKRRGKSLADYAR